jgi:hypothetical protein
MSDWVQIGRDPFARHDIVRRLVDADGTTCSWCGRVRRGGKAIHPDDGAKEGDKLFQYAIDPDAIQRRLQIIDGLFCTAGCRDAYRED